MQKTIEITTTQNVTIEYELAELRERMARELEELFEADSEISPQLRSSGPP